MYYFNNLFDGLDNNFDDYGYRTQRYNNDNRQIILRKLYNDDMNHLCFDCHKKGEMPYIDLKNGIFLCFHCAKKHSSLPKEISEIVRNNLREMSEENLRLLYYSGNKKLLEFMSEEYPQLEKMTFLKKYKCKAMEYYRQLIKSQAYNLEEPIKPNKREAYISIYEKDLKKKNIRKKDERNEINNDLFSNLNNTFGGFFGDNDFFNLRPAQTERNLSKKKNNNLDEDVEMEEEKPNEIKENKESNKNYSDCSDEDTGDEDKRNNKSFDKKENEIKKEEKCDIKNEEIKKEIPKKIEKPIEKFEIKPTSDKININQMGCIERYPEALNLSLCN